MKNNTSQHIFDTIITSANSTQTEGIPMLDNHEAIKLTGDARKAEIISRLNDYDDKDLLNICRDANSWDGSFDFCDVFDIEDLCSMVDDKYELVRSVIYGNVTNVVDMVRYDAYGNLENVTVWDLYKECTDSIDYIADWLMDDWQNTDSLYEEDEELFNTWWEIDHDQYDWDEEEEDE